MMTLVREEEGSVWEDRGDRDTLELWVVTPGTGSFVCLSANFLLVSPLTSQLPSPL